MPLLAAQEAIFCERCRSSPPPFNRLCALFSYQPPIIRLIGSLKFGQQLYPATLFSKLLAEAINQCWYKTEHLPQVIIPVPLHSKRQRQRGYNQAAELSKALAKHLDLPLGLDLCSRIRNTAPQARLSKETRRRNLSSAFAVHMTENYKHVALVDDVVTTGSTVRALSLALRTSGVEFIDLWCVARA